MKLKSLLLALLIPGVSLTSTAQKVQRKGQTLNRPPKKEAVALYSLAQLEGKWQEIKRSPLNKKETVSFSDTLLMNFRDGKVELKDATSMTMSMNGTAQIEAPNTLIVAGDVYGIRLLNANKLIIDDGEFMRELNRKDQFYYETVGKIKVARDSFSNPVNIDINNLKGKWVVYARKAEPGATTSQTAMIRSLEINSISEDGIAFGQVVSYTSDISKSAACRVITKDGTLKIVTDKDMWIFYSYKADGNEFVFGEIGKLVYYSKH